MNDEALHQIRLGEIGNALGIIVAESAATVVKAGGNLGFFKNIKVSMAQRRKHLAAGLNVVADLIKAEAKKLEE